MVAGSNPRGKSEHHRTECRLTAGEGDFKESATEIYRHIDFFDMVRLKWRGKSSPTCWQQRVLCKPHLMQGSDI